jgi:AhpD family alkylhydroperoxidase
MMQDYPQYYNHLRARVDVLRHELPGPMSGFGMLHKEALADGTLSVKTKELIALAIAVAVRCDGCVAYHVHDALQAGATRPEILEALGVAVLMGGGPALMYSAEALDALEQFYARK